MIQPIFDISDLPQGFSCLHLPFHLRRTEIRCALVHLAYEGSGDSNSGPPACRTARGAYYQLSISSTVAVISKSLNLPGDSARLEMEVKKGRQTLRSRLKGDISRAMLWEGHGGAHSGS